MDEFRNDVLAGKAISLAMGREQFEELYPKEQADKMTKKHTPIGMKLVVQ